MIWMFLLTVDADPISGWELVVVGPDVPRLLPTPPLLPTPVTVVDRDDHLWLCLYNYITLHHIRLSNVTLNYTYRITLYLITLSCTLYYIM